MVTIDKRLYTYISSDETHPLYRYVMHIRKNKAPDEYYIKFGEDDDNNCLHKANDLLQKKMNLISHK